MKKTLLLMLMALMCAFNAIADDEATELNCEVEVNSDKITSGSKDIFNELKQAITDYMNTTKWTNATFGTNEKIYCKLMFTISGWDNSTGAMEGDLQIQSQRPVYNSSYTTAIINFRDTKVKFFYETGQQLVFSEMEMEDNLTAILNFWAYMIIAMDFDTFELNGGDPYYERAAQVVRLAQSSNETGWKAFEDNNNRSAVLSAFTEKQTAPIRQMLYDYHRMGLDQMVVTVDKGRSTITHTLENLGKIYEVAPMSICLTMFKDAKLDELINIYSKANTTEKESVYEMLYQVYPSETTRLDQIKKTSNN
ncbi:MAG: DUF4835 family protein [Muribaculaceae bacterium]|nr:DUF4835 family protein [Muribaculaceae bacterium]